MPGASHAPVDDAALTERPVLVLADVGNRRNLSLVAEYCYTLTGERHDDSTFFWDVAGIAHIDEPVVRSLRRLPIDATLLQGRGQMQ